MNIIWNKHMTFSYSVLIFQDTHIMSTEAVKGMMYITVKEII